MSAIDVVSQARIEEQILRLTDSLESATDEFAGLAQDAAEKESAYKRAYYSALMRSKGSSVGQREADAFRASESEFTERKLAEALRDSGQERLRSLRAQLSALQTLSANVRNQT